VVILGRKIFRRDDLRLAQERKPELNKYMNELLKLNENISQSKLVLDFFARQEAAGDMDRKDLVNDIKEGEVVDKNKPGTIVVCSQFIEVYQTNIWRPCWMKTRSKYSRCSSYSFVSVLSTWPP
jgi:hypothetical protein